MKKGYGSGLVVGLIAGGAIFFIVMGILGAI